MESPLEALRHGGSVNAVPETESVPGTKAARRDVINVLRVLAMDAVQKANSGHPGMPMGMAEIAEVSVASSSATQPRQSGWEDRDRFVLSNGHGSMLLYALLHLTGYDLPMEQIERFRQLHSQTPGHPEYGLTPRGGNHHRPAGAGYCQCAWVWRSPRSCWRRSSTAPALRSSPTTRMSFWATAV